MHKHQSKPKTFKLILIICNSKKLLFLVLKLELGADLQKIPHAKEKPESILSSLVRIEVSLAAMPTACPYP